MSQGQTMQKIMREVGRALAAEAIREAGPDWKLEVTDPLPGDYEFVIQDLFRNLYHLDLENFAEGYRDELKDEIRRREGV